MTRRRTKEMMLDVMGTLGHLWCREHQDYWSIAFGRCAQLNHTRDHTCKARIPVIRSIHESTANYIECHD